MHIEKSTGHIVELQSLRGLAAVAVMIGHALIYYDSPSWFDQLAILANGRAAVVIFFVLSGYVLTRSLRNARFDQESIFRFYVQRLFRIYPVIWIASAFGLLYIFGLHWQIPVEHTGSLIRSQFRLDRTDTLHIVASLAAMTTFILPQLWSIFIELVASLMMPGIAFIMLHRPRWAPGLLGIAMVVSFTIPDTYYYVTMYLMDFVVGSMLAMPGMASRLFGKWPTSVLIIAGLSLILTQQLPIPYWSPSVHLIETLLSVIIIGILIDRRVRALQSKFLLLLGDTSYSIYLLHYIVLCTLAKLFTVLQSDNVVLLNIVLAVLTCVITIPLAWVSYTYVEKPGIQLGKLSLQRIPLSLMRS